MHTVKAALGARHLYELVESIVRGPENKHALHCT